MTKWRRVRGRTLDRGAAAVEFALVVPLLLLLVMGILDYGRFFFDSVSLRQGAREAARQAVVQRYGSCTGTTTGAKIACAAKAASDVTLGTPVVHIPPIIPVTSPDWSQGNQLLVCMASLEQGTGFVPLPNHRIITTKTYMSIEVGSPVGSPIVDYQFSADTDPNTDPTTGNWNWCK